MVEKTVMTMDEVEAYVGTLIDYAEDFIESEYSERRETNWKYYHGGSAVPKQKGRHNITMAKARDILRMVEPAVLRPFATQPNAVEFSGRTVQGAAQAEYVTAGVRYWFYARNNGYLQLASATRVALVNDACVFKSWWDPTPTVQTHRLTNLSLQDVAALASDPTLTIQSTEDALDGEGNPVQDLVVLEESESGRLVIETIPLEDFLIDNGATGLHDARIVGHRTEMTVADAVDLGLEREDVLECVGEDTRTDEEERARKNIDNTDLDYVSSVEDNLPVVIYELYVRMDPDNTGVVQLYKCMAGGDGATKLFSYEPVDEQPFSIGSVYPLPFSPFGEGLVDVLREDQDAFTSMMREMLDNLQLSNKPGKEVVEGMVNISDLMNTELGRIVRTRAPNMIKDMSVSFVAGQTLPIMQFMDSQIERKTGISSAAMGFSPDMLQSTTKAAVDAANQAAQGQVEYMARNIAETALKPLFRRCAKLLAENMDRAFWVKIADQMVPIDPRGWTLDMDVEVNVGLGTGRNDEKVPMLTQVVALQKEILTSRGIGNGIVSLTQFINTISDLLATVGLRNPTRYIGPSTPQLEKSLAKREAEMQQQSQQGGDPTQGLVEAEKIKSQTKLAEIKARAAADREKASLDARLRIAETLREEDLDRDQMLQDLVLKAREIEARYGAQVDVARVRAEQERTGPNGADGA